MGPRRRSPRTAEVVTVAALSALAVIAVVVGGGGAVRAVHVVSGLGAVVAYATRGRHLVGSSVAVAVAILIAIGGWPIAAAAAAVLLLVPVARWLPATTGIACGVLLLVSVVVATLVGVGPFGAAVAALVGVLGVGAGASLRGADWRRAEELATRRREERLEIAGELHDVVGHHLTGIVVQAQAAQHLAAQRPAAAVEALARIEREGATALAAVRQLVGEWRDGPAPAAATWQDVRQLVARRAAGGLPVTLHIGPGAESVPPEVVASVHRVVTEALTNAARHAGGATAVGVDVARRADRIEITVVDDGAGATAMSTSGHGLAGMRERVARTGGAFEAGPEPGGGWRLHVALPVGSRR